MTPIREMIEILIEWRQAFPYVLGYAFSLLGAGIIIPNVLTQIRSRAGGWPVFRDTRILGTIEAAMYTTVWTLDERIFIAFWLGLKTIKEWGSSGWSHEGQLRFNTHLIGSLLSLAYAVAGAELISWLKPGHLVGIELLIPFVLVIATLSLPYVPGVDRPLKKPRPQSPMEAFFAVQKRQLEELLSFDAFAIVFSGVDRLYDTMRPFAKDSHFGRFLLMEHKAFLTAASLIGQAQPDDAHAITRRAIEMIQLAAAVKRDPAVYDHWLAFEKRHERWLARQRGERPKRIDIKIPVDHPIVHALMVAYGILSDAGTHFTPEFYGNLGWEKRPDEIFLNYFTTDQRALESAILNLAKTHLQILQVLSYCLDDKPLKDDAWGRLFSEVIERRNQFARRFKQNYGINVDDSEKQVEDFGEEGAQP